LSWDDLRRRFGQFELPAEYRGLFDPQAGLVLPERAIAAQCELALRGGAELHGHEPVVAWESDGSSVTVHTKRDRYQAGHVVFCAGAWSGKIVLDLGVELAVTRQVLGWVWPRRPEQFELGTLPVWMIEQPDGTNHYGFPLLHDSPGFKVATHNRMTRVDPATLCRDAVDGDENTFRPFLRQFIPNADGPLLSMRICMYTNTPDLQFIIDVHPRFPNVTIACGFSGHGFKFAPVIGQALADLATAGKTRLPIGFLGLSRFRPGGGS
jgi:sarcosine oxidase